MTALETDCDSGRAGHALAGATVLQAIPVLTDDRIGRTAFTLALAALRSGARAIVVGSEGPLVGELQAVGGEWMDVPLGAGGAFARRRSARALRDLLSGEKVELVHAHGAETGRRILPPVLSASIPVIVSYHGLPGPPPSRRFRKDPLARADVVLAPSEFAASRIVQAHGVDPARIGVIARAIDSATFDPSAVTLDRVASLRDAWHVHPHQRIVLAVSRPDATPGLLTLVDAMRVLLNGGLRNLVVVIVGESESAAADAALTARIAQQGLSAVFRRMRACADMPAAYTAADLVLLASEQARAFDARAAEAHMMARPVIAPDVGMLHEIVLAPPRVHPEDQTGWLFAPEDTVALARALAAAIAIEPHEWRGMAERARQFAARKCSGQRITEATLAVYGAMLRTDS